MGWQVIIFELLGAFLADCQRRNNPEQTTAQAQADLRANYDALTGKMNPQLVRRVVPQVRRAEAKARREAKSNGVKAEKRMSQEQARDLAEKKLIQAMAADGKQLKAAFTAAWQIGDNE